MIIEVCFWPTPAPWLEGGKLSLDDPRADSRNSPIDETESMTFDEFEPDGPLTPEQEVIIRNLSSDELAKIDEGLLSNCCDRWRKVARVVATTMTIDGPYRYDGVPDIFYSQRVKALVEKGRLESQGNLDFMRYSEVRLHSSA